MIKYFHELTEDEFNNICRLHITWDGCSRLYPQPKWCGYPDAVQGLMGCWSLMCFMVTGEKYCKNCDCYIPNMKKVLNEKP